MKLYYCLFLFLVISGCTNSDDFSSIHFDKDYYEKPLLDDIQNIVFGGGSGDFSVKISDSNVLDAFVDEGKLQVKTKTKGTVSIIVRDNLENTQTTIQIKVVDKYLHLQLSYPIPDNFLYKKDDHLFLVNDEDKSFYLYNDSFNLKDKGNYRLFRENDKFCLSLSYSKETLSYDISRSSAVFLWGAIPYYLDFSWVDKKNIASFLQNSLDGMTAVDFNTGDIYYFVLSDSEMPYGILE